jgi:intracellular septation protein A
VQDIIRKLAGDFLSTLVFLAVLLATGDAMLATGVAIAGALAQIVYARLKGIALSAMTWASLGLVLVLGGATLLTNDPRFVLVKPSIAHFAIGAIMLKPGWLSRYMPPIVLERAPDLPVIAGYGWAALMFALGCGTVGFALTGDMKLWGLYVAVVLPAAKVIAFAVQYVVFRLVISRRIRRAAAAQA